MWRNRHRTFITMSAIFFAVILSILTSSLKTGIFDNLVKNLVGYFSGYVQVHQKGYWDEQILDNSFCASDSIKRKILATEGISSLAPRLQAFALASAGDHTKGCLVVGVDPLAETDITGLPSRIITGRYFRHDESSVLLSEGLATRLGIGLNDTVILIGQGYHGSMAAGKYPIVGLVKFGTPELNDQSLFLPLKAAQDLYGAIDMITAYVLRIDNPDEMNDISTSLQGRLGKDVEVMTWQQMMPEIEQHIRTDTQNMQVVHYILYLLICFGVFGTLLMMMAERRYEIGMLIAIGMKKSKLIIAMAFEMVLTVFLGCLSGVIFSIPIVLYFKSNPLRISGSAATAYERFGFEPIFPASSGLIHFTSQALIILILGLVMSLYPVYKIWRMDPINAMKK